MKILSHFFQFVFVVPENLSPKFTLIFGDLMVVAVEQLIESFAEDYFYILAYYSTRSYHLVYYVFVLVVPVVIFQSW